MWVYFRLAFVVAAIGGMLFQITEVDTQSTVDDSASCESSTLDEAVDSIKHGMNNVWLIREDLEAVKNLLESTQQPTNASSSIIEAVNLIREDLEDVKSVLESNQQQNNASCIFKKDLEDLKAAFASNQQQCSQCTHMGLSSSQQTLASPLLCEYRLVSRNFYETRLVVSTMENYTRVGLAKTNPPCSAVSLR